MKKGSKRLKKALLECAEKNYTIWETLGWILGEFELYLPDKEISPALEKISKKTTEEQRKYYE